MRRRTHAVKSSVMYCGNRTFKVIRDRLKSVAMDINKPFFKKRSHVWESEKKLEIGTVCDYVDKNKCVCVCLCVCVCTCVSAYVFVIVCVSLKTGCDRAGLANIQEADGLFKMERTSPAGQVFWCSSSMIRLSKPISPLDPDYPAFHMSHTLTSTLRCRWRDGSEL